MPRQSDIKQIRTLRLAVPNREWAETAAALCHEAKNLYNITTFLIRQIFSAYEYQAESKSHVLRTELHQSQIDALDLFNRIITEVNEKRLAKAKDLAKFMPIYQLEQTLQHGPLSVVLHRTVIDNAVRSHIDENGHCVYRRLPAVAAQQVVLSVVDLWKASLAAQKDYFKNPAKYTGRPQFPSYLAKNETFQIEFPMAVIKQSLPRPRDLFPLNDEVTVDALERFHDWNIKQAVFTACQGRGWRDYHPKHIRIMAESRAKVRIEAVVHLQQAFPEGSLLHRIYQHYPELAEIKKVAEKNAFLIDKAQSLGHSNLRVAAADLGENNVATVSFSTGHKAHVHDGDRFAAMMDDYNRRIDKLLSSLVTPRIKELQAKQAKENLSKAERIELRKEQKELFNDPVYKALTGRRMRRKADYEHKLTSDIVDQCLARGIDLIIIGRNKGWKNEANMGRKNNRSFHGIAYARLINLIRYKAEAYGMAVVTVEESYTSKTSFIDGDELRNYADKDQPDVAPAARMSGYRSTENRNWFVRRRDAVKPGEITKVHADVNGAFNIIRKVFKDFCYHAGLSLKFTVRWISPRRGAVLPVACL